MPTLDGAPLDPPPSPAGHIKRQGPGLLLQAARNELVLVGADPETITYPDAANSMQLLHKEASWRGTQTKMTVLTITVSVLLHRARDKLTMTGSSMSAAGQRNSLGQVARHGMMLASSRFGAMETGQPAALACHECLGPIHGKDPARVPYCPGYMALHCCCETKAGCPLVWIRIRRTAGEGEGVH